MIGVPQLCGNKDVFPRNPPDGKSCLQGFSHLTLIPVSFRAIEVSKSSFQRVSGSTYRSGCIGNQGAKPEHGHMAGRVVERHSLNPQIRRFDHDDLDIISRPASPPGYADVLIFVDHGAIGTQF
jgi:hypothetical protein